ncbi:hypothetical protein [Sanguibacter suaedae]|uniref:Uncharacterized protein n=1 Tax=Sanguibacter suaedae TaxID=2795737 RepID=A0A934I916_9MICO|nr:hypothetical protein [Sanguibacter suaedae]MBI9115337.1 hypothetical protein [Sanguibacter suaedae]
MTPAEPHSAGRAVRAVFAEHARAVAVARRWTIAVRTVTLLLLAATLLGLVGSLRLVQGASVPWPMTVSPLALLVGWLLWKDEICTLLGRPAEPRFPHGMLRIAVDADTAEANPRPFGSVPASMRTYRPESR